MYTGSVWSYVFDTSAIYSSVTHPPFVTRSRRKERRECFLQRARIDKNKLAGISRNVAEWYRRKTDGQQAAPKPLRFVKFATAFRYRLVFARWRGEAANIPDIFRCLEEPLPLSLSLALDRSIEPGDLDFETSPREIRETMVPFSRSTDALCMRITRRCS